MPASSRRRVRLSAAAAVVALLVSAGACGGRNPVNPSDYGIVSTDLVVGSGTEAEPGRGVTVHYTLWLHDASKPEGKGAQIETSRGGQPFSFALGFGQVIAGWDIGIDGMRVGGQRRLVIPSDWAYGPNGQGQIPGGATLVFDVELVGVF